MTQAISLNIVGCGKLGRTLARLWLDQQLISIAGICNQSLASAEQALTFITGSQQPDSVRVSAIVTEEIDELPAADLWLIATPDSEITSTAAALYASDLIPDSATLFHCSGSLPSTIVAPKDRSQHSVNIASVHPVHSFALPESSLHRFRGTFCAMEGDEQAIELLTPLFEAIGGQTFTVNSDSKPLYHAATAVASNYLVAIMDSALNLLEKSGVPRLAARELIRPIIQQTAENVCISDTVTALTGPISRGDHTTIEHHLSAIQQQAPELLALYKTLGQHTLSIAEQQSQEQSDPQSLATLKTLLES